MKRLVAYHEAGHAIVGALMPEYDPVTKITIVPRGPAGGITFFAPSEERLESGLYSRTYLENQMAVAMGGRRGRLPAGVAHRQGHGDADGVLEGARAGGVEDELGPLVPGPGGGAARGVLVQDGRRD